jgi:3-hydroxyisobutyrate dehydrogenase-like beta-hydroxyacid dehydrogenase
VTSSGRAHGFPLPLSSTAEQSYLSASAQGFGRQDDSGLVRLFNPLIPEIVHERAKEMPKTNVPTPSVTPLEISKVGFVGLGAMGIGMAASLLKAGFEVSGYDIYSPSVDRFLALDGKGFKAATPANAAKGAEVLILMVQNAAQAEDVLFGSGKAVESLPDQATVILNSTVPPSFAKDLGKRLASLGRGIELVDAPVSGGVARAALGQLTVSSSSQLLLSRLIQRR